MANFPSYGVYNFSKPNQYNFYYTNSWGRTSNLNFNLGVKWGIPTIGIKWRF